MKNKKAKSLIDTEDIKTWAFLATFLSIIGFIIVLISKKKDKYVMFYAKQSVVVFVSALILGIIGSVFLILPVIGSIIYFACHIVSLILWVLSWVYALSGEEKEVPIVGCYADKIKL